MSRVVAIIQARMGSTRLPGKITMQLAEKKTLLRCVVERARRIVGIDHVVVAMPFGEGHSQRSFVSVLAPNVPEHDVLGRYAAVARQTRAEIVMRLTGDCGCLNPSESGRVLALVREHGADFVDNVSADADGTDTEVFTAALLERAAAAATNLYEKEHVTPWLRRHAVRPLRSPAPPLPCKLSVDTIEDLERARLFWYVDYHGGADACWLWRGPLHPTTRDGECYGIVKAGLGRGTLAHRRSWELLRGPIPDGMDVLHRCDVKCCVRPSHLYLGTDRDNQRDVKTRTPYGKLTDAHAHRIRDELRRGVPQNALAEQYGITSSMVSMINTGRRWF